MLGGWDVRTSPRPHPNILTAQLCTRFPRPIRRPVESEVIAPRGVGGCATLHHLDGYGAIPRRFGRAAESPGAFGGAGGERRAVGAARLRRAAGERGGVV